MRKIFLLLICFLLIANISALDSLGTYRQNENVRIVQVCSDATYITISSISFPNSTTAITEVNMTSLGSGEYYYDFNNTITLGRYDIRGISDGCENTFATYFDITGTGLNQSTSQGIGSAMFLFLMIVLMFVFGIVGFRLFKTKNLWVLGVFFEFLAVIFLIYNTWLGYQFHRSLTGLPDSKMPEILFYIFLLLLILGLLVSVALLVLNWKKVFKYVKREIKKKDDDDSATEDWDFDKESWRK